MTQTFLAGLGTGLGLIVVIGAQNIFVLTNGMRRRHLLLVPLVCFLCDAALLSAGIAGLGSLLASQGTLLTAAALLGMAFLAVYGWRALRTAWSGAALDSGAAADAPSGRRAILLATLGITLLNPHVYLDTVVLMGSVGSRFPWPERGAFLAGAACASLVWFFGLSLFGRLLAPFLHQARVWRLVQAGVCALLWFQAASLGWFAAGRIFPALAAT